MTVTLHAGDCRDVLRTLDANSVDSIVTDPPYGLGFMGKAWDHAVPGVEFWTEMLRVAKPGAYLLAFGGTRTSHRMACAIEDAGWEMRDTILWLYGSGFPKSHNGPWGGTALKPAHEPIIMARKPLIGTVAANVLAYGTGGLNIDGCRVGETGARNNGRKVDSDIYGKFGPTEKVDYGMGRWPANVIHDGSAEVLAAFPQAPGQLANASTNTAARRTQNAYGAMRRGRADQPSGDSENAGPVGFKMRPGERRLDSGSAARFFYCAKADNADRNDGCDALPEMPSLKMDPTSAMARDGRRGTGVARNNHPTVKPTDLMRYLCRLVTPPGGVVLDPFMGSGSTGRGASAEGFQFVGIELDPAYAEIARCRIDATQPGLSLMGAA